MPLAVTDPYAYTSRFGAVVGMVLVSLFFYWLANKMLARRGRHLAPEMKAIVLGGILILAGYSLPWASVKSDLVEATLFANTFDLQLIFMLALVVIMAALASSIWDVPMLQASLLVLAVGAAVVAGLTGWQYTHADRTTVLATFAEKGPPFVAGLLHITPDRAALLTARVASAGSTQTSNGFGPWVVVAGSVLAAGASAMILLGGIRSAIDSSRRARQPVPSHGSPRGRTQRGWNGPARGDAWGSSGTRHSARPAPHPASVASGHATSPDVRKPAPVPVEAPVGAPSADAPLGAVPPPPPMPSGTGTPGAPQASAPSLGGRWTADSGKADRRRSRGRRR